MAKLTYCDCDRGLPATRFLPRADGEEDIVCRFCADAAHVDPNASIAFMQAIAPYSDRVEYVGNGNSEHVPVIEAQPRIRRGHNTLEEYLFPRFKLWETRDIAGRLTLKCGPKFRRIAVPVPGTKRTVPVDIRYV